MFKSIYVIEVSIKTLQRHNKIFHDQDPQGYYLESETPCILLILGCKQIKIIIEELCRCETLDC